MDQNEERMWKELEERRKLLAEVARRASLGEHIVLIYPSHWPAKEDLHTYHPLPSVLRVSDMQWRFPNGGWVMFRTVNVDKSYLHGLMAEFIWVDDAAQFATAQFRDEVTQRNLYYRHRMNTRYPIDESDC